MPTISIANRDLCHPGAKTGLSPLSSGFPANLGFTLLTDRRLRVCPVSVGNMRGPRSFPKRRPYVSLRFAVLVSVKCSELNVQTDPWNFGSFGPGEAVWPMSEAGARSVRRLIDE